ncbi:MAG: ATP synthase F1 subunit gamma [Oscillospiraceae bacterium]|nr:ATP synthase F1 subunit gamma [Bacillota bacterium]
MAGVSTKDIKQRIRSMESTRQITRAMEMVAASKLRRAQDRIRDSRPYFEILYGTIAHIACTRPDFSSPYLTRREGKRVCCIVIAGDRGLAGGYNNNVFKLVQQEMEGKELSVLPMGKRAVEHFRSRGVPIFTEAYGEAADVSIGDCFSLSKQLAKAYLAGELDEICVAFTNFVSVLTQTPAVLPLLPLSLTASSRPQPEAAALYEPDPQTVFDAIIPEYLGGVVYGALCESVASELAARRTAMDAATKNADEMIGNLNLQFNRARQGAITQEITEIVAGAEA